jgi:hypothetical protein
MEVAGGQRYLPPQNAWRENAAHGFGRKYIKKEFDFDKRVR